jgi:hypothetical protein
MEIAKPAMGASCTTTPSSRSNWANSYAECQLDTEAKVHEQPLPEMSLGPKATYTDTFLRGLNAYFGL